MLDKSKNNLKKYRLNSSEKNLINKKFLKLKILGNGEIKNTIEISAHFASKQKLYLKLKKPAAK